MSDDVWKGKWKQMRGKIQQTWGVLTDDELDEFEGKRDQLVGALQEKTGKARKDIAAALDRLASEIQG